MMGTLMSSLYRTAGVLLLVGTLACPTREDAARRVARQAALAAARECADAAAAETCSETICRDQCSPYADSPQIAELCRDQCLGRGTCNSDRDCAGGLVCLMIAPRLRRCVMLVDGAF